MRCFAAALLSATLVAAANLRVPTDQAIVLDGLVVSNARETIDTNTRAVDSRGYSPPSLAAIFAQLITETRPYADELRYLTPENATKAIITDAFTAMDTSFSAAVHQVQALAGQDAGVVLASVDGQTTLTLSELGTITKQYFSLISNISVPNLGSVQSSARTFSSVLRQIAVYGLFDIVKPIGGFAGYVTDLGSTIPHFLHSLRD